MMRLRSPYAEDTAEQLPCVNPTHWNIFMQLNSRLCRSYWVWSVEVFKTLLPRTAGPNRPLQPGTRFGTAEDRVGRAEEIGDRSFLRPPFFRKVSRCHQGRVMSLVRIQY